MVWCHLFWLIIYIFYIFFPSPRWRGLTCARRAHCPCSCGGGWCCSPAPPPRLVTCPPPTGLHSSVLPPVFHSQFLAPGMHSGCLLLWHCSLLASCWSRMLKSFSPPQIIKNMYVCCLREITHRFLYGWFEVPHVGSWAFLLFLPKPSYKTTKFLQCLPDVCCCSLDLTLYPIVSWSPLFYLSLFHFYQNVSKWLDKSTENHCILELQGLID